MNCLPKGMTSDHLLRFLENCKSLKVIRLAIDIDEQTLAHLAGREGLVGLLLISHITYEAVKNAFGNIQSPFKKMQDF